MNVIYGRSHQYLFIYLFAILTKHFIPLNLIKNSIFYQIFFFILLAEKAFFDRLFDLNKINEILFLC